MFRLATVEGWFDTTRSPELKFLRDRQRIGCALKTIGHSFVISTIRNNEPRRILEFGHAHSSPLSDLFGDQCEIWGIDDARVDYVAKKALDDFRTKHEESIGAKFIKGYLGEEPGALIESYFDLVCSVSTVEHIPSEKLSGVFKEIARVLKPGGLAVNSYDVFYDCHVWPMFKAHINAGLQWLDPRSKPFLDWDSRNVCFEDPKVVLDYYMTGVSEQEKTAKWPGIWATVLMAAKKPDEV